MKEFLLRANLRHVKDYPYFFGGDNHQMGRDRWHSSSLKVLHVFLSPGFRRAKSMTFFTLQALSRQDERVFCDYCFLPSLPVIKACKRYKQPFLVGNVSQKSWKEYDIVSFSISILPEVCNIPFIYKHHSIPIHFDKRVGGRDLPIFLYGGMASPFIDILFGSSKDGCFPDVVFEGHAEAGLLPLYDYIITNKNLPKIELYYNLTKKFKFLYIPSFYEYEYQLDNSIGYRITNIKKRFPDINDKIEYLHMPEKVYPGMEYKVLDLAGDHVNQATVQISNASCSGGMGSCSFCVEGQIGGRWYDHPFDKVGEKIKVARRYSGASSLVLYSFNTPYYYKFLPLLIEVSKVFPSLPLINLRTDCFSADPSYMDLATLLSSTRLSTAIEGVSERIRNGFLNKNLSREEINKFYDLVFSNKIGVVKNGFIFTGYETKEDWNEFFEHLEYLLSRRDKFKAKTFLRLNFTPLIYYPHTPLQRLRKKTALLSYRGEHMLVDVVERVRKLGLFIKILAKGRSTFIEQFFLTWGRNSDIKSGI